jgi:hypothetical protein
MTSIITVDIVDTFAIHENYWQRYPCNHLCEVALKDGRKFNHGFDGDEIYLLIKAIAKEKISFIRTTDPKYLKSPQTMQHFDDYSSWVVGKVIQTPDDILTKAFKAFNDNVKNNHLNAEKFTKPI